VVELTAEALSAADAMIIVTDRSPIEYEFVLHHAKLVVDTRNATTPCRKPWHTVVRA
jgi:UDP-N-acetyl-D-glucosamine dehydrogenase